MSTLLLLPLLLQYQRNIALGGYAALPCLMHQPLVERPVQLQEQLHGDDIARESERTVKDAHTPSSSRPTSCHCMSTNLDDQRQCSVKSRSSSPHDIQLRQRQQ